MIPSLNKVEVNLKYLYENHYQTGDHLAESYFLKEDGTPDFVFSVYTAEFMENAKLLKKVDDSDGVPMYRLSEYGVRVYESGGWDSEVDRLNEEREKSESRQVILDQLNSKRLRNAKYSFGLSIFGIILSMIAIVWKLLEYFEVFKHSAE